MTEFNAPATLITPAFVISIFNNRVAGDDYFCTNITGLDSGPIRAPEDDKPATDGGILYPFLKAPRHITIEGILLPNGGAAERNVMEERLKTALESIENADGTWQWTPTGLGTKSIVVRCDIPVTFPNAAISSRKEAAIGGGFHKNFIFGLVAADPTIHNG